MDWPTLEASVDLALKCASKRINFMFLGGEPLLEWENIRKAVDHADRHIPPGTEVRYRISTNGLLLTDEIADFLEKHDFTLQLSFDGIAEAQNYRREGTFAAVDKLLDRLRERQPVFFAERTWISMTVIPATIVYLAESTKYLIQKGVRNIGVSPSFTPSPGWTPERIQSLDDQFSLIYEVCLHHYEKNAVLPMRLFREDAHREGSSVSRGNMCSLILGKTLAVDADGQGYGCALLAESYQEFPSNLLRSRLAPLRMGDVRGPGFSERYAALREAAHKAEIFDQKERKYSSYGSCAECECLSECFVCPVSIGYESGNTDPHRVPDFICAFNRVAHKYRKRFPRVPDPIEELEALLAL